MPETGSADTLDLGEQGSANPLQINYQALVGQELIDENFPNSIPLFGSDVRIKFGGYVKLDVIQDFDNIGSRYEFESATIPVKGTPEAALGGRTTIHAKETRFNFDVRTVVENERHGWKFPLKMFIEFDFFEDNPTLFRSARLRQAYGVIGRLLAGQTWNITGDLEALPGIIDFGGGDGVYGDRVSQIRWQDTFGEGKFRWTAGIEEPKSSIANPDNLEGEARPNLPNMAGSLRWGFGNGSHLRLGLDVFQQHWQGGTTGPNDKTMGYGLNFTGRFLLDKNNNNSLMFGTAHGRGTAHRILLLEFSPNDAVITQNGLEMLNSWQAYAAFNHYWTKDLNSTVAAYWASLEKSSLLPNDNIHNGGTFHANLVWFPYKLASVGVEYMRGIRRNKDGAEGVANRVQLMVRFIIP